MTYEDLLRKRAIETAEVSDQEIAEHLRGARHDIATAQNVINMDLDWAFNIAYNGIRTAALSFMNFKGYRPRGEGKHYNTFEFLKVALSDEWQPTIRRIQKMRQKRNMAVYEQRGIVSEKEAKDIIEFAGRFHKEITSMLPKSIVELSRKED